MSERTTTSEASPLARSRSRLGALAQHARHDPRETTAAARARFMARFAAAVAAADPDGQLDPVERARRIEYTKRLYFARLAHRSAVVRAANARARKLERRPWLKVDGEKAASDVR